MIDREKLLAIVQRLKDENNEDLYTYGLTDYDNPDRAYLQGIEEGINRLLEAIMREKK